MRKKHQAIYDNGYTAALRDVTIQINERGGVSKENVKDTILHLMEKATERYDLDGY